MKKNKIKTKVLYPDPKKPEINNVLVFLCQNYYEGAPLTEMVHTYIEKGFADELIEYFSMIKTTNAAKERIISEAKKYPEAKFEELPIYIKSNS